VAALLPAQLTGHAGVITMALPGPPGSEHHTSIPAPEYFAALQHQTRTHRWLAAIVGGSGAGLFAT
jgi:hypothetical protein